MWYEVLPSAAIICALMYTPQVAAYYLGQAVFGNPFKRDLSTTFGRLMFLRDTRIDGAPWKVRGLENIPDEK